MTPREAAEKHAKSCRISRSFNAMRRGYRGPALAGADLSNADLREIFLIDADLRETDFRGADLRGASFDRANLQGALFEGTKLEGSVLPDGREYGTGNAVACFVPDRPTVLPPPYFDRFTAAPRKPKTSGTTFDRITVNPEKMGGVPCIRDLRMPVITVVRLLLHQVTPEAIVDLYPDLEREDIFQASLFYGAGALLVTQIQESR